MGLLCAAALSNAQPIGIEDVPALPSAPSPDISGPYGTVQNISDFRERAIIRSAQNVRIEDNVGYGMGRTTVEYNEFSLEADRMVIDFVSGDITAEGNIIFRSPNEFIKAERGRFNLTIAEGVAYGVDGQSGDVYFKAIWEEEEKGPSFRQIDEKQSIFRGAYFTTSAFPVPQYYVAASEVILIKGKRIFFRNPVLYIRGVPMFYLPFYTRNLETGSPWSQEFGYNSSLGGYFRLGYRYIHRVRTPDWEDPEKYRTKSHGLMDTYLDLMSIRGIGLGARYTYQFDYYRHTGYLQVYGLRDWERDVKDERAMSSYGNDYVNRWVYRHKHYTELTDNLIFQADIDKASDPDVYYDVLDLFSPDNSFERGRLFEQRMRAALTLREKDYIARLAVEHRERLGRNLYIDYSDPFADDLDYDLDPTFTDDELDDNGYARNRYGTVSENVTARYATRLLNLAASPIYYRFEANAFDSLDSGFNTLDTSDNARVQGGDLYGEVTLRLKLGPRTTWTNSVGGGVAYYDRQSNDLVSREDFREGFTLSDGSQFVPNGRFDDRGSIILGAGETQGDIEDVEPSYLFADYTSRLNHRFTDFLDGYLKYFIREGTDHSLGEYYELIGRTEAAQDIYNFYSDKHYAEAGLNFYLRYPNLFSSIIARQNLQDENDIYANEQVRFVGYNLRYSNPTNEFRAALQLGYDERQIRDRDDPRQYTQPSLSGNLALTYIPRHARYWAKLVASGSHKLEDDPVDRDNRQKRRFDENATEVRITPTLGRQFGPKYRVQISATYNTRFRDVEEAGLTIIRDLADAELGLFFGVRNNGDDGRREDDKDESEVDPNERDINYEYDVRASLKFMINRDQPGLGQRSVTTLADLRREAQYVQ